MAIRSYKVQIFILVGLLVLLSPTDASPNNISRHSFPPGFIFGAASASYQSEGAANEGGRGPSIWDTFTKKFPEKIADGSNGDVANDFYHRYKEDIGIMKKMNLDAFRFSISWSRILPSGKLKDGVNKEGIKFYNNLIDELLANGIQPFVTLFHWDLPQALEDEYGGFLSSQVVNDFRDYVELCFREFGDRVKQWITLNEPWSYSERGYAVGEFAPGRCSYWQKLNCTGGDSATEPYLVAHNLLLAHAAAVEVYKQKFQVTQHGKIGITLVSHWFVPYSNEKRDKNAARRALEFMFGWFMDPVTSGRYPQIMQLLVKNRLPKFSKEQSNKLKGSFDFLGLNYYTARYAAYKSSKGQRPSYLTDIRAEFSNNRSGILIGPQGDSEFINSYPKGLQDLLLHIKKKYKNPNVYITENGVDEYYSTRKSLKEALADDDRINYHYNHLLYLQKESKNGSDLKGYFAWSLLDDFEWSSGYISHFGMNYVDYTNGLKRYPKESARWFGNFLKK